MAAILLTLPGRAAANGTDILHFMVIEAMTNNGVEVDAGGVIAASQVKQGNANNQKLTIAVTGLATNAPYELVAAIDNDTNLTDITSFETDSHGDATLDYTSLGNGHGGGHHAIPLPASLNPVSLVRGVAIFNGSTQLVLSADISAPDKLDYLIKRDLSSGGVKAGLMIQANTTHTHFQLLATGLKPSSPYLLAFNGDVVQTNSTTAKGRLDIHSLEETPPLILDLRSVELLDGTNVVLHTSLP